MKEPKPVRVLLISAGCFFSLWVAAAMISGLSRVNWQMTELARQYLIASGMVGPIHTLVDFYTHIKGIEYIICVVFFVAFPLFFQYVERRKSHLTISRKTRPKN